MPRRKKDAESAPSETAKRRIGRPKKTENTVQAQAPSPKRRGRPPGRPHKSEPATNQNGGGNGSTQIQYRFVKGQGGKVILKGLENGDVDARKKDNIAKILTDYGFTEQEQETWIDCTMIDTASIDQAIHPLLCRAPIAMETKISPRGAVKFVAQIDTGAKTEGREFITAFAKAHSAWNKADRPINGVTLIQALNQVIPQSV